MPLDHLDLDAQTARSIQILADLVAFDTTSRNSNLALIAFVADMLADTGVQSTLIFNDDGTKANLLASIGPFVTGGVVLSGHTDVVPVDGQAWISDPFTLSEKDGLLFGRGTCDMKGFLACALAAVPLFQKSPLRRPVHLAFSYDEEVGCLGAPALIASLVEQVPLPSSVIVGEPTMMHTTTSHKGILVGQVTIRGHEAHSSLSHMGVSANMVAIRLLRTLDDIAASLTLKDAPNSAFVPAHSTMSVGLIRGGTAANILARECQFTFDLRCIPGDDPDRILDPLRAHIDRINMEVQSAFPDTGVTMTVSANAPPLAQEHSGCAERLVRSLTGDNEAGLAVPYGAEAGQFQAAGMSTVICGPGSIEQAHQENEFIAVDQMRQCMRFLAGLAAQLQSD